MSEEGRRDVPLMLVGALREVEALELAVRRLWVEVVTVGGALPDVEERCQGLRDMLDGAAHSLGGLADRVLSEEIAALATEARAEGADVEEFVTRRLEECAAADGARLGRLRVADGSLASLRGM